MQWNLISLTITGRNVNNYVISGNDFIVYRTTVYCQ